MVKLVDSEMEGQRQKSMLVLCDLFQRTVEKISARCRVSLSAAKRDFLP